MVHFPSHTVSLLEVSGEVSQFPTQFLRWLLRNCTTDDIRDVLGKYKRESAAKAGQHPGIEA
jgi:hypothetical protein